MVDFGWRKELPLSLGQVVATPGALKALEDAEKTPLPYLIRHASGDFGQLDHEDFQANVDAILNGGRVMSVYPIAEGVKIWIITEWDRSVTTILLPEEY